MSQALPARNEPIVGIDLGTTNSLVAVAGWDDPAPRILPDEHGRAMLPSVVRFAADGTGRVEAIGDEARAQAVRFPERTVSSVKRLMGRSARDAAADIPYLSFAVVEGEHQTARVQLPGGRTISPQEVSAIILRRLKEQASRALGVEVRKAVVTVPAYFDDAQRQATRDAGRLAGLDVVRIVNEPTAAALAYGLGVNATAPQVVVVYDLGGGTFDVSVLRLTPAGDGIGADIFQVLSTAGDTHLGGDDFDHALVALFTREIRELLGRGTALGGAAVPAVESVHRTEEPAGGTPAPPEFDPETRTALRQFAEQVKIKLSMEDRASVRIDLGGGRVYDRTITRAEFESMIAPLVERSIDCCKRALRDARRQMDAAGEAGPACVVLVGGATRTPLVRGRVEEVFGMAPYTALDPDRVVALGAAVQARVLARNGSALATPGTGAGRDQWHGGASLLLDVLPLSLGIETRGGGVAKLIMRNSTVPARATEMFSTSIDGQTSIKLHILQGEREMAADCRSLGEFNLSGLPPMPAGIPQLEVEFLVDANGVLNVSAVEKRSGKRAALQIVPNHGLTREEVERIERESIEFAREDMTRHRVADLVTNSRLDVHWIEQALARVEKAGNALLDAAYLADLKSHIARLRSLIASAEADWRAVDANDFQRSKEALDRLSMRLHEVAITQSLRDEPR
ncbi:MAG: Hsp70 family protein [Phycisphaeraceae bacterium]|nr:Hsp70 family protein [Phycisphaeraceae bacterium]